MKEHLRAHLEELGLSRIAHELTELAEPAIRFKVTRTPESGIPLGASKLGGKPDLPPEIVWPVWNETPLSFLLQINLEDLREYECEKVLPSSGILYFFYDPEQRPGGDSRADIGGWEVIFSQFDASRRISQEVLPGWETLFSQPTDNGISN